MRKSIQEQTSGSTAERAARRLPGASETLSGNNRLIEFPGKSKRPPVEPTDPTPVQPGGANRPAAHVLNAKSDLVLRASRETGDVIKVARRLGVRANDVFRVVLKRLDEAEGKKAA